MACTLGSILTIASTTLPAGASPAWWRYVNWNLHGYDASHGGNAGGLSSVDDLIDYIDLAIYSGTAPAAVSVQEICWDAGAAGVSQYDALANYLVSKGYQPEFGFARYVTSTGLCDLYGDAVFAWGSYYGSSQYTMNKSDFTTGSYTPIEDREMVCLATWVYTVVQSACSTHLDSVGDSNQSNVPATFQVGAVLWMLRNYMQIGSQYVAAYLGGDFNQDYDRVYGNAIAPYSDHLEAETIASPGTPTPPSPPTPPGNGGTEPGGAKIDYTLVRSNNFYSAPHYLAHTVLSSSDHELLAAAFYHP